MAMSPIQFQQRVYGINKKALMVQTTNSTINKCGGAGCQPNSDRRYVCGGGRGASQARVWTLDTKVSEASWQQAPSMNTARGSHVSFVLDKLVYVAGALLNTSAYDGVHPNNREGRRKYMKCLTRAIHNALRTL